MTTETLEAATFHISAPGPVTFEVDRQERTIRGVALPFGDVGTSGITFHSSGYGSKTFVSVQAQAGTFTTVDSTGATLERPDPYARRAIPRSRAISPGS